MPTPLDYRPRGTRDDQPPQLPRPEHTLVRAFRTTVVGGIVGFAATFGLYAAVGGWGPPDGGLLTIAGLVVGLMYGVGTVPKGPPT